MAGWKCLAEFDHVACAGTTKSTDGQNRVHGPLITSIDDRQFSKIGDKDNNYSTLQRFWAYNPTLSYLTVDVYSPIKKSKEMMGRISTAATDREA